MKRALILSVLSILLDQALKFYFQFNFIDKKILLGKYWGLTYATNPGIWINRNISTTALIPIQITVVVVWIFIILCLSYYHRNYRRSLYVDLSFASFSMAIFGNVIVDRLLLGYVRDYFINPIAIANLADIGVEMALVLMAVEMISFPKAREILRIGSPEEWLSVFQRIIKRQ
jgi:hypothetical protein